MTLHFYIYIYIYIYIKSISQKDSKLVKKKKTKKKKITCWYGRRILSKTHLPLFTSIFSLIWRDQVLVGLERKLLSPTMFLSLSPLNQTHLFLLFSSLFSILPIPPLTKRTLSESSTSAIEVAIKASNLASLEQSF